MAEYTFSLVSSLMYPRLFNTLDTVVEVTPASAATSLIVGIFPSPYLTFLHQTVTESPS